MIYSFKSHKLAMIDFILNFIVFLFRLKKNHFNDHLPFYCERQCWHYSLLKALTSLCQNKQTNKKITA